ncbi:MAG: hypothetical protein IT372_22960 [Polyangiaceae bacterium]|nr:hypothetical protein [Polyangiaceae bacterium]
MPSMRVLTRRPPAAHLALAAALLAAPACGVDLDPASIPWPVPAASSSARASQPAPSAPIDCDDLPSLTPEELARPPREVALGKSAPADPGPPPPYAVLPDVVLSNRAAAKMAEIDRAFARKTGSHVVITSGTRDSIRQAKAMYKMLRLGADILELYRNRAAALEIKRAYDDAAGKRPEEAIASMDAVIRAQMDRGVFISAHLRAGAVDVRSRNLSASERRAFVKSVEEVGGASLLEESRPPHYHLQIE